MTSASSRGRFEREATTVARIQNPHVIQIYDYGIEDAQYIVMELLESEDMEARIVRNPRLSIAAVATMVSAKVFNIVRRIQAVDPSPLSDARTVQMDESSVRFAAAADADRIQEIQAALDGGSSNR